MESDNAYEQLNLSTFMPLLDSTDTSLALPMVDQVTDTFVNTSLPSTIQTDNSSLRYSPSYSNQPVGLTPDEAAELLKALDALEASQSLADQFTVSQDMEPPYASAPKQHIQERKPVRTKCTNPSTGKMRNPSRERLQNELAYLRTKAVELERELRMLHLDRRSNLFLRGLKARKNEDGGAGARVWQRIAQRQAQGRDAAEAENTRLKTVLQGQIQVAQKLEKVLHKRPNVSVFSDLGANSNTKRHCLASEDSNSMYELFLSELDGLYAQMDGIFQQNGIETSMDDSLRKADVRTRKGSEDQDELYTELQDVNIVPFDFEKAASALWYAVKKQYSKNRYHSYQEATERPEDTIAVKYRSHCKTRGVDTQLDAILVMRRYIERDRLAIVWRSVSRGEDELSGMYTDETGWSVLKRIPLDSGLNLTGCIMHNSVHIVPKRVDCSTQIPQDGVGLLTNLVIDSYEDDVIALSSMMEDLLLQESVEAPRHSHAIEGRSVQLLLNKDICADEWIP